MLLHGRLHLLNSPWWCWTGVFILHRWSRAHLCQASQTQKNPQQVVYFGDYLGSTAHSQSTVMLPQERGEKKNKKKKKSVFASLIKQRTEPLTSYKMSRLWINSHQCWCCCWLLSYHGDRAVHWCQAGSGTRSSSGIISGIIFALPGPAGCPQDAATSPTPVMLRFFFHWGFSHLWDAAGAQGGFAISQSPLLSHLWFLTPVSSRTQRQ